MFVIYKKELKQYFYSMIGFIFLAFFLAIVGIYTWAYNFASGMGNFEITLGSISFLFVLLVPILTMRIIAEENHQKTTQLLYTAPVSIHKIVIGKYLAVISLFLIGIGILSFYPLIIHMYGKDVRLAMAYSSIIGFFLLGSACISIGMYLSSLTESQPIAAVSSFIVLLLAFLLKNITNLIPSDALTQCILASFICLLIGVRTYSVMKNITFTLVFTIIFETMIWIIYAIKSSIYTGLINNILNVLAISNKFDDFSLGILKYDAIVYYLSIIILFHFLTVQNIKKKRFQ